MFVLLYEVTSRKILATMNVNKKECTTSEDYVSCDVVDGDSRKSSLSALISDLAEGQSRVYGCNLTALMSRSSVQTFSWSITVQHIPRKLQWRPFSDLSLLTITIVSCSFPAPMTVLLIAHYNCGQSISVTCTYRDRGKRHRMQKQSLFCMQ